MYRAEGTGEAIKSSEGLALVELESQEGEERQVLYSLSTRYAIRACIHLAQVPGGQKTIVKTISDGEDIPAHFLAKILQQLARSGLLVSSRGPTGGFRLRVSADKISLMTLIHVLDGPAMYPDPAVAMYSGWRELQVWITDYLRQTTIADLAASESSVARLRSARKQASGTELRLSASQFH
jgi:Rrf2 family protein